MIMAIHKAVKETIIVGCRGSFLLQFFIFSTNFVTDTRYYYSRIRWREENSNGVVKM
jgi:hypothetical protein